MAAPKYQPHHWGKPNYYKLSVEDAKVEEGDTAYFKVKLDTSRNPLVTMTAG